MTGFERWILGFTLMLCAVVQAQESSPRAPDPLALEASWWSYFDPAEPLSKNDLKARIDSNRASLEQILSGLNARQQEVYTPLVKQINEGLERFAQIRDITITNVPAPPPPADLYTLAQALERFILWRQLKREAELEEGELEWQKTQLAMGRKRQAKLRGEYLSLAEPDPQRLSRAMELMSSRVSLELASLQTKKNEAKLKLTGNSLQRLEDELASIRLRLMPSPGAYADLKKQQAVIQKKADVRREKAIAQSYSTLLEETSDPFLLKYRSLVNANIEIETGAYELAAKRYGIMAALEVLLKTPEDEKIIAPEEAIPQLRDAIKQFQLSTETTKQQIQFWRSLISQTRKFVAAQNSGVTAEIREHSAELQRLGTQMEANDRRLREFDLELEKGNFIVLMAQEKLKDDVGWLNRGLIAMDAGFVQSWDHFSQWMNTSLVEINEVPLTSLGLLRVIIIIFLAWLASRVLRHGLDTLGAHNEALSPSAIYTLGRVVHYVVLILGIIMGLSSIGLDFTKFALFASALGVGIGFGLQNLIGNFVSGLIILFEKSLKVGDFVELSSGLAGEVKEINMRGTLITTNDNIDIIVPNSDFVNSQVTNWTLREVQRRIHVPFGVAYGTNKDIVKKAALEAADAVKWTLNNNINRRPKVWLVQFGDSSLNFELVVWLKPEAVKRPSAVHAAYLWEIDTKLREYGIEIPFPQRDLHLRSVFGQKDDSGLSQFSRRIETEP